MEARVQRRVKGQPVTQGWLYARAYSDEGSVVQYEMRAVGRLNLVKEELELKSQSSVRGKRDFKMEHLHFPVNFYFLGIDHFDSLLRLARLASFGLPNSNWWTALNSSFSSRA